MLEGDGGLSFFMLGGGDYIGNLVNHVAFCPVLSVFTSFVFNLNMKIDIRTWACLCLCMDPNPKPRKP